MYKEISSIQNPIVKDILQLQEKSRIRKLKEQFVVEGLREIHLALKGGYEIITLLFCEDIIQEFSIQNFNLQNNKIIKISKGVYEKLARRDSTEGVIAIILSKKHALNSISFKHENPLILVVEAPEKPGNIGALLRTADAAALDAVLIANPKTDLYNPNIIRSSVGCVFTNKVATGSTHEIISFLKKNNIAIYSAALNASQSYESINYRKGSA
ncbi:MAG: RNA methyltransferase, partial [Flavobacteriaceae bacterium]|nr:RNA methyltransferase [Flavobacteriaceae bacterium]